LYTATPVASCNKFLPVGTADEPTESGGNRYRTISVRFAAGSTGRLHLDDRRNVCASKAWPLESVTGRLRHSRIYAADCANCETKEGKLDRIERDVQFAGGLDSEQRTKLLEIANKCPVDRTLLSESTFRRGWSERYFPTALACQRGGLR
jgi:putative redox protein